MDINYNGYTLYHTIINELNQSQLPIGMAYFIILNITQELEKEYINQLNENNLTQTEDLIKMEEEE